ncbi:dTMP kinase [Helicobacter cetorum]|uniref:Thymidylate kinase n=1 Tax=Helicobacter cetorum (strain ATCC BAA-540 / CCUG 52418 / MIT 99-5656) TaxID=1163745 RepID=I0ESF7_HELCM|nr:dTMP kinase [Helicobacter cetorum]AFI05876.1 thymidylate kinase [Helicobacter cetorum MIT 99-5656]
MYITIEGIDGAGKSTQIELLKTHFKNAVFTKEPGGTKIGQNLREIALNENLSELARAFLFLSDRAEHIESIIKPALKEKKLIISDRSLISGMAYSELSSLELNLLATQNILPQKIILLLLDAENLKKRLSFKTLDKIENQGTEKLLHIQQRLKEKAYLLKEKFECEILELNAKESIEDLHQKIIAFIECVVSLA